LLERGLLRRLLAVLAETQEKVFVITLCDGQSALLPNTLVSTSSWLQRVYPPVRVDHTKVLRDLVLRMQVSLVAAMPQHLPGAQTMRGARSLSHHPAHCVGFLLRSTSTLLDPSSRVHVVLRGHRSDNHPELNAIVHRKVHRLRTVTFTSGRHNGKMRRAPRPAEDVATETSPQSSGQRTLSDWLLSSPTLSAMLSAFIEEEAAKRGPSAQKKKMAAMMPGKMLLRLQGKSPIGNLKKKLIGKREDFVPPPEGVYDLFSYGTEQAKNPLHTKFAELSGYRKPATVNGAVRRHEDMHIVHQRLAPSSPSWSCYKRIIGCIDTHSQFVNDLGDGRTHSLDQVSTRAIFSSATTHQKPGKRRLWTSKSKPKVAGLQTRVLTQSARPHTLDEVQGWILQAAIFGWMVTTAHKMSALQELVHRTKNVLHVATGPTPPSLWIPLKPTKPAHLSAFAPLDRLRRRHRLRRKRSGYGIASRRRRVDMSHSDAPFSSRVTRAMYARERWVTDPCMEEEWHERSAAGQSFWGSLSKREVCMDPRLAQQEMYSVDDAADFEAFSEQDAESSSERDGESDSEQDAETVRELDSESFSGKDAESVSEQDAGSDSEQDAGSDSEQDSGSDSEQDAGSDSEQDAEAFSEQDAESLSEQDAESVSEQDAESFSEQDAESDGEQDVESVGEQDVESFSEQDAESDSEQDADSPEGSDSAGWRLC